MIYNFENAEPRASAASQGRQALCPEPILPLDMSFRPADIFNLDADRLLNPVSIENSVVARLDRVTSRLEDTTGDATVLEKMVDIFQFESFCLREEEIYHGNLFW